MSILIVRLILKHYAICYRQMLRLLLMILTPDINIIFLEGKKRHVRIFQNLQAIFLSRKKKKMGIFLIGYQVLK